MTVHILYQQKTFAGEEPTKEYQAEAYPHTQTLYLYALVLLRCEFVRTDGSDRDVGSHQSLVLEEEGQGIHPA